MTVHDRQTACVSAHAIQWRNKTNDLDVPLASIAQGLCPTGSKVSPFNRTLAELPIWVRSKPWIGLRNWNQEKHQQLGLKRIHMDSSKGGHEQIHPIQNYTPKVLKRPPKGPFWHMSPSTGGPGIATSPRRSSGQLWLKPFHLLNLSPTKPCHETPRHFRRMPKHSMYGIFTYIDRH